MYHPVIQCRTIKEAAESPCGPETKAVSVHPKLGGEVSCRLIIHRILSHLLCAHISTLITMSTVSIRTGSASGLY